MPQFHAMPRMRPSPPLRMLLAAALLCIAPLLRAEPRTVAGQAIRFTPMVDAAAAAKGDPTARP